MSLDARAASDEALLAGAFLPADAPESAHRKAAKEHRAKVKAAEAALRGDKRSPFMLARISRREAFEQKKAELKQKFEDDKLRRAGKLPPEEAVAEEMRQVRFAGLTDFHKQLQMAIGGGGDKEERRKDKNAKNLQKIAEEVPKVVKKLDEKMVGHAG